MPSGGCRQAYCVQTGGGAASRGRALVSVSRFCRHPYHHGRGPAALSQPAAVLGPSAALGSEMRKLIIIVVAVVTVAGRVTPPDWGQSRCSQMATVLLARAGTSERGGLQSQGVQIG